MSQFAFLQAEFAAVFEHAGQAETLARSDPRAACFYTRLALETAVGWMYQHDGSLRSPYGTALSALIHEATFLQLVGNALVTKARLIKDFGNRAVHDSRAVSENTATVALRELFHFSYWLVRTYAKGKKPEAGLQFSADALPKTQMVEATTLARLQSIAEDYAKQAKAREEAEAARLQTQRQRDELEAQIQALRVQIEATKKANQAVPDDHDYNEAQTRDAFIDLLLNEAGWPLDQARDREFPVTGMPNATGKGFVDNVLWGDDGKPLALVESKRTKSDAWAGQQQVKLYGDCMEAQYRRRSILFFTNGYGTGHFGLIVIDEAHRSVYRKYRAIFDYFDSYLVGLTATPRDEIDRDTYSLFDLERGAPTDAYDLDEAVADGFLVPPIAVSVPLKFQREGIRYDDLSDEEKEQWDALEWTDDGDIPDKVDASALNKWLFN
ncbi:MULTISPECIES: DEAD/DEAH box helicase family protein [unclassified Thiocapsa]|uniref:DEAD/DEAH box helicase family protein n=1 Tax=unclassified Thiocapsa TaxID=2641286 RepID=UPI0035B4720B